MRESAPAIRSALAPDVPNNAGSLQPIDVIAPLGSILNVEWPAPVAARHIIGVARSSTCRCGTRPIGVKVSPLNAAIYARPYVVVLNMYGNFASVIDTANITRLTKLARCSPRSRSGRPRTPSSIRAVATDDSSSTR